MWVFAVLVVIGALGLVGWIVGLRNGGVDLTTGRQVRRRRSAPPQ